MTRRDDRIRFLHMLEAAREAIEMAAGKNRADLDSDRKLSLALTRLLEIVGEAAARIPPEARIASTAIPWAAIVGMRNRLIHNYDDVDLDIVWAVITQDLPPLVEALTLIVDRLKSK